MKLTVATIFSNNMVLQNGEKVPVWGFSKPGDKITVEFSGQKKSTTTKKDGSWKLLLNPLSVCSKPETMTVSSSLGKKKFEFSNVLVGEVWICSGQSNMQWTVADSKNADEEISGANYPNIRLFTVPRCANLEPDRDIVGAWDQCSPETVGMFAGVGYFFGREVHRRTGVPVGLINSSWGGTYAEAWTSKDALNSSTFYRKVLDDYKDEIQNPNRASDAFKEWTNKFDFKDTENAGLKKGWHKPEVKVAKWSKIDLPSNWQGAGHEHSGIFWFRNEVDIPKSWKGKELTLSLGALDKSDITYFNGIEVGGLTTEKDPSAWNTPRIYKIPGKLVKSGKNVIAVRVYSNIYHGGFIGTPNQMKLFPSKLDKDQGLSLAGIWNYNIEANFGLIPPPPPGPRGQGNHNSPHILFDNMIKPLIPYAMRGVIWYQGESNAGNAKQYRELFPLMINSWRKAWKKGDFPFIFVQLANYRQFIENTAESDWAELREAQTMTLSLPKTDMAVTIDIGEFNDIHPKNKQDVGLRLALPALAEIYDFTNLIYSGPIYKSMRIEKKQVRIGFEHVGGGLVAHGKKLEGFSIAGKDKKFVWANAKIDGDTVVVSNAKVAKPVAVRYAWADNPKCNLYNSSDLPASPFRTDDWPGITN